MATEASAENWATAWARDVRVWQWLVALLVIGILVFALPIPRLAIVALVFGAALIKAVLVVRNYMHLKAEHLVIYLIVLIPVMFVVGLMLTLIPDIGLGR